jgi:peptide/nickel transport system substrate-binding protein
MQPNERWLSCRGSPGERINCGSCARRLDALILGNDLWGPDGITVVENVGPPHLRAPDKTVKITLKRPFPLLIDAIAVQNSFIMPERLAKTDPFKAITEVVGSGPFRFLKDEFVAGSSAAWEKFDGYVPGAAGMDLGREGCELSAHRVEGHPGRSHSVRRAAERRG